MLFRTLCCACAAWLWGVEAAWATTPLEYTHAILEQARAIVASDQTHNAKLAALSVLLKDFLDTDDMGKAALGKNASRFTRVQQREFLALFGVLFQRTYVQKLLLFDKPDFGYVGEERLKKTARVDTKIITPRDEFAVTYQLRPADDHWLATDVRIEDLSLTMNFRRQIDRLLSKASVDGLLRRMRRKYGPRGPDGADVP
ncbi:MAG: phospholipid-binding protein MlaC [Candidatus Binatia bacterium]